MQFFAKQNRWLWVTTLRPRAVRNMVLRFSPVTEIKASVASFVHSLIKEFNKYVLITYHIPSHVQSLGTKQ